MKLRNSFNYRTFTGLTALLVTAGGTASAEPTLRMRPGPRRLAQATPPAHTPVAPPVVGRAPPAGPPPSRAVPLPPAQTPPASPDAAPDGPAAAPDAAPAATATA